MTDSVWCEFDLIAGVIDLAVQRNCLIGGDDFKSGQTKMKSVLVDFLVGAGIKVHSMSLSSMKPLDLILYQLGRK